MQNSQEHEIVLYQIDDSNVCVSVIFKDETFWLSQNGMAELFGVNIPDISKHLSNIFSEGELEKDPTVSKMEIVQNEGGRFVRRKKDYYNLDAIIAVGYRNSVELTSSIPVGWRQPSYKKIKRSEELKVNFLLRTF